MIRHFVIFYSPGTIFSESTTREIDCYDIDKAVAMAKEIKERYGAIPYGFRFATRARGEKDLDSKETHSSGMYYLGGIIETIEEIRARNLSSEKILLNNMECNGWDKVITNKNSYITTQPFLKEDTLLDVNICELGSK